MKTLLRLNRWHLWVAREPWVWFEVWLSWDYHNYIISASFLTIQLGWEWVWKESRNGLGFGGSKQIVWIKK